MAEVWTRTCQECGHQQPDKEPKRAVDYSNAYANRKCKSCESPALDYGRMIDVNQPSS